MTDARATISSSGVSGKKTVVQSTSNSQFVMGSLRLRHTTSVTKHLRGPMHGACRATETGGSIVAGGQPPRLVSAGGFGTSAATDAARHRHAERDILAAQRASIFKRNGDTVRGVMIHEHWFSSAGTMPPMASGGQRPCRTA